MKKIIQEMEAKFSFQGVPWSSGFSSTCIVESASINKDNRELKFNLNGEDPEAIEAISIQHSSIPLFPLNLSKTFPNLAVLQICGCGLTEISRSDLIGLEGLVEFNLSGNKLTSLPRDLLVDMKKLKYISLDGNQIATLDVRMFDGIKNQLEMLDLSRNYLDFNCYLRGRSTFDEFSIIIDPEYESKLSIRFEDLWKTRRFSDFTIVVAEKEFKVHKAVLATRSKVFSEMFEENLEGKSANRLTILDFTAEAFEDFMRFLYTDKSVNGDNAMELFSLATIYDVADLKSLAENIIWNKIDGSNAVEVLIVANKHGSEELMTKSFAAIKRAYPEIDFDEGLVRNPQDVENLIRARQEYEEAVENAREELENQLEKARKKLEEAVLKKPSR